jgi:hypothetical protein
MIVSVAHDVQLETAQGKAAMNCKAQAIFLLISSIQARDQGFDSIAKSSDPIRIIEFGEHGQTAISAILEDFSSLWGKQLIELLEVIVEHPGDDFYPVAPFGVSILCDFGESANIQKENGSRKFLT